MQIGFQFVAAKPKSSDRDDAPSKQPMRAGQKIRRKPSADQKKIRRQISRTGASSYESVYDDLVTFGSSSIDLDADGFRFVVVEIVETMPGAWDIYVDGDLTNEGDPAETKEAAAQIGADRAFQQALDRRRYGSNNDKETVMKEPVEETDVIVAARSAVLAGRTAARQVMALTTFQEGVETAYFDKANRIIEAFRPMGGDDFWAVALGQTVTRDFVDGYASVVPEAKVASRKTAWSIDQVREVVDKGSFATVDGMMLDLFSASAIVQVYDALNDTNKERLEAMPLDKAHRVVFQLINKSAKTAANLDYLTWSDAGEKYRPGVKNEIPNLDWVEASDTMSLPMVPGLAIEKAIQEFRIPNVKRVAWNGVVQGRYGLYGIEAQYANGLVRIFIVDYGTGFVPVASGVVPGGTTAGIRQIAISPRQASDFVTEWFDAVDTAKEELRGARSVADVLSTVGDFWGGDGAELWGVLSQSGWTDVEYEADYHWSMRAPDGSILGYIEGDLRDYTAHGGKLARRRTARRVTAGGPYHEWYEITQTVGSPPYQRTAYEYQAEYAKVTVTPFQTTPGETTGWIAYVTQTAMPGYSWGVVGETSSYGPFPTLPEAMRAGIDGIERRGLVFDAASKTAGATLVKVRDLKVGDQIAVLADELSTVQSIRPSGDWGGETYELVVSTAGYGDMTYNWPADLDIFVGGMPTGRQLDDAVRQLRSSKTAAPIDPDNPASRGFEDGFRDRWDDSLGLGEYGEEYGDSFNAGWDAAQTSRQFEVNDQIGVAVYGPEGPTWQDRHDKFMDQVDQLGLAAYSSKRTATFEVGDRVEVQQESGAWNLATVTGVDGEVVEYERDDGYASATRTNGDPRPIRMASRKVTAGSVTITVVDGLPYPPEGEAFKTPCVVMGHRGRVQLIANPGYIEDLPVDTLDEAVGHVVTRVQQNAERLGTTEYTLHVYRDARTGSKRTAADWVPETLAHDQIVWGPDEYQLGEGWPVAEVCYNGPHLLSVYGEPGEVFHWIVEDRNTSDYVGSGTAPTVDQAKGQALAAHYQEMGGQLAMFSSRTAAEFDRAKSDMHCSKCGRGLARPDGPCAMCDADSYGDDGNWIPSSPPIQSESSRRTGGWIDQSIDHIERTYGGWYVGKDFPDHVVAAGPDAIEGLVELAEGEERPLETWNRLLREMTVVEALTLLLGDVHADFDDQGWRLEARRTASDINGNDVAGLPDEDTWLDNEGQFNEALSHQARYHEAHRRLASAGEHPTANFSPAANLWSEL